MSFSIRHDHCHFNSSHYHWTVSREVAFFPTKNHRDAIMGPAKDATPWKPWLKFRRAAAYFGEPNTEMYELAATSRHESPQPITKVHPTKPPYFSNLADGQKNMAPDGENEWELRRSGRVWNLTKRVKAKSDVDTFLVAIAVHLQTRLNITMIICEDGGICTYKHTSKRREDEVGSLGMQIIIKSKSRG